MTFKNLIEDFKNKSFHDIKNKFPGTFSTVLEKQKHWLCPIEEKLYLLDDTRLEKQFHDVIAKLKDSNYSFGKDDIVSLSAFTRNINKITRAANFLNNFKQKKKLNNGEELDLSLLFNQIKLCDTLLDLSAVHKSKIHVHIDNLFSVIKHCQNPDQYPINYRFWKNMATELFNVKGDYDSLTIFYREFPEEQRHLNFGVFMGTVATELATFVNKIGFVQSANDKIYKQLTKLLHIEEYKNIIHVNRNFKETILYNFENWLKDYYITKNNEELSEKSIVNYIDGIRAIDRDFIELKISSEGLISEQGITYIDTFVFQYRNTEKFIARDKTGRKMYSSSLNSFISFIKATQPLSKKDMNSIPLNTILYGPPGTGKTFHTVNKALKIILEKNIEGLERRQLKELYDDFVKDGRIIFTTFHQSLSYEDFIEGIKPLPPANEKSPIQYAIEDGIFKKMVRKASQTEHKIIQFEGERNELTKDLFRELYRSLADSLPNTKSENSSVVLETKEKNKFGLYVNTAGSITVRPLSGKTNMSVAHSELEAVLFDKKNPTYPSYENPIINKILEGQQISSEQVDNRKKNYVIIIDEINRGNISQIFGELITLIETDKRLGNKEELTVTLPYSKASFGVPNNVYIIGTMNTADRSVEALDTALRRRFVFEEMIPAPEKITEIRIQKNLSEKIDDIDLQDVLKTINLRIEKLIDRDHAIGHSYFLDCVDIDDLRQAFYKNIIPLLQEYFFHDYAKIGLILGPGFVQIKDEKVAFAQFEHDNIDVLNERRVYEIIYYKNKDAIQKITYSGKEISIKFADAITLLLNQKLDIGDADQA